MHKLTGSCHMCGMCCKAIVLPVSYDELKERSSVQDYINGSKCEGIENNDVLFVWLNWKPISKEEAFKINPHLRLWEERFIERNCLEKLNFWTCTKHDPVTNKCTVHEHRPKVCSDFPWYGRSVVTTEPFYSPECGYKVDIDQELKLLTPSDEDEEE